MASHTTTEEVKRLRGWSDLQYQRFHTVVIKEGRKLAFEDKYWQENKKPENLVWSNLSVQVITKLVENVRNELQEDDMETKMQIDAEVIRWKLLPWLRKKHNKARQDKARQTGPAVSSPADRSTASPRSCPLQYYDPVTDAAKENPGAT